MTADTGFKSRSFKSQSQSQRKAYEATTQFQEECDFIQDEDLSSDLYAGFQE